MSEEMYRKLKWVAVVVAILPIAWLVYEGFVPDREPGDVAATAGDRAFADHHYERALEQYQRALEQAPDHLHALRGKAATLTELGFHEDAVEAFTRYLEEDPGFAGVYANRGIAYDRMGRYEEALRDYERALILDPSVADGPGWLTKFLHIGPEGQPTIADRAGYIRAQLALPEEERVLSDPELDSAQRSYSQRAN